MLLTKKTSATKKAARRQKKSPTGNKKQQQRRVLHARARHGRRRRARHGAHHHPREALRRRVLQGLGQCAARGALGADQGLHARVGRRDLDDPRRDDPPDRASTCPLLVPAIVESIDVEISCLQSIF